MEQAGTVEFTKYNYETKVDERIKASIMLSGGSAFKHPAFNKNLIMFNGSSIPSKSRVKVRDAHSGEEFWAVDPNDLDHEGFAISRVHSKPKHAHHDEKIQFDFCKTARKPYDIMVVACLILYKYYFRKEVKISSDGDLEEWQDAFTFIAKVLPHGKEIGTEFLVDNGKELFEDCLSK